MRAIFTSALLILLLFGAGCATAPSPSVEKNPTAADRDANEIAAQLTAQFNARDPAAEFQENLQTGKVVFYLEGGGKDGYRMPGISPSQTLVLRSDPRVRTDLVLRTDPPPEFFSEATWAAARDFMQRYNAIALAYLQDEDAKAKGPK